MTFQLYGAPKSAFQLLVTNYKDGQIMLLEGRLFGLMLSQS